MTIPPNCGLVQILQKQKLNGSGGEFSEKKNEIINCAIDSVSRHDLSPRQNITW